MLRSRAQQQPNTTSIGRDTLAPVIFSSANFCHHDVCQWHNNALCVLVTAKSLMQVLQSIIEFAGLPDAEPVDPVEVQAAGAAAAASSTTILASIEPEVIQNATLHFAPQMLDLQSVLDTYFPDADLPGLFR